MALPKRVGLSAISFFAIYGSKKKDTATIPNALICQSLSIRQTFFLSTNRPARFPTPCRSILLFSTYTCKIFKTSQESIFSKKRDIYITSLISTTSIYLQKHLLQ